MIQLKRITSTEEPPKIQRLGDNSYYYNYDAQFEGTITREKEQDIPQWSFTQVHLYGYPNYKDCAEAIIRSCLSESEEFNIINSYNREKLLLEEEGPATIEYKEYLEFLGIVKRKVKEDFTTSEL